MLVMAGWYKSAVVCSPSTLITLLPDSYPGMRQVPLERDINIAVNGCSGFATSTRPGRAIYGNVDITL